MSTRDALLAALKADPTLTAMELASRFEISRQRVHQIASEAGLRTAEPIRRAKLHAKSYERRDGLSNASSVAPAFLGAAQELVVSVDLMKRGAHVYRAISHASPADLVACVGDQIMRIQVRSGRHLANGALSYSQPPAGRYDVLAVVDPDNVVTYKPELAF